MGDSGSTILPATCLCHKSLIIHVEILVRVVRDDLITGELTVAKLVLKNNKLGILI